MILNSFLTSPVTKRHVERKILNTPPLHLFRIIQDVDQYSKCVLLEYDCAENRRTGLCLCMHIRELDSPTCLPACWHRFLPLCSHSQILRHSKKPASISSSNNDDDLKRFEASLTVGLPPFFTETYVSDVTVIPSKLTVETVSIQSKLFDSLKSRWQLSPAAAAQSLDHEGGDPYDESHIRRCHIDFEVELTVSDPVIKNALDQVLQQVAGRQVEAFAARCRQIPVAPRDLQRELLRDNYISDHEPATRRQ